ncbi:P-loop containing nucleoside triphosphate hydrolase protein [Gymnopilus junonius]|uniref:P-loop containing nucleoside triphosphate hydrolase protein n=1 Tax=Gymnopilus junonius TaxID=109634 RepID=A0A9P5NEC6_GYMJU|nr:P-loop containing nucleoside triphosphate hydrolase protein [Gymnopilus junonius]
MHQFMCHKYLKFTFGPQINFIIGGKSAVLSAITVALGGKATSTGRGNGLKSFIREGQSAAEVTIHIKNQGEEAYKPKEYGKTIVITRKFSKEGSSSWKIKSKDGKVISTKKDELAAICDHMNIQVDNPMNVLTQDSARQFLSASAPQDKYNFFLRGTQLSQLSDEYTLCMENINQTSRLLSVKKEALPDLRARKREAQARYDEAAKAREQKKRVDDLKKEKAWSHVAAKEAELESKVGEVARLSHRLPKIEESVQVAEAEFNAASEQVALFEQELENLESVEHLNKRKNDLQDQMRTNRDELKSLNREMGQISQSLGNINTQISDLEHEIKKEAQRMAINTQEKHEETQRKLEEARTTVSELESNIKDLIMQRKDKGLALGSIKTQGEQFDRQLEQVKKTITDCEATISMAKRREQDALVPYGNNIKLALEKIKGSRWHGDMPLGPLGLYVTAKEPQVWGDLLRSQLGGLLTAFAITDARDRPQLRQILQSFGNQRVTILVHQKDLFDYRSGEPPEDYLTVLRALNITDPHVARIMINQQHIESRVLAHRRSEAQQMLKRIGGGSAWSLDRMSIQVFPEGGSHNAPLNFRSMNGPMSLLLTGRDSVAEIQIQIYRQERDQLRAQYMSGKAEIDRMNERETYLNTQLHRAKAKFNNLQAEANEELPAGLAGFEEAKKEAEAEKQSHMDQFAEVARKKAIVDEKQTKLQDQMNEIRDQLNEFQERRNAIGKKIEDAAEVRIRAQNNKKHYEAKYEEEKRKVEKAQAQAKILQEEFTNWRASALEYCEQIPNPRKTEIVERQLASVEKALKERERIHGVSVEDMAVELNKAADNLEKAEKELKQMATLNKALKASLIIRLARWQEFRRHIALRCKHVFQYHLSRRGYYGKILFDHTSGHLNLRVQTDDQLTQGTRDKDPRSLSGGEKSFSTICLLLSLWECIGCPLRCLDEFDVFMDAVNRRISMKMMIDTANTSDRKQYILITPQDMTNVAIGPSVRVLRMSDPERGNGTLPFGSSA